MNIGIYLVGFLLILFSMIAALKIHNNVTILAIIKTQVNYIEHRLDMNNMFYSIISNYDKVGYKNVSVRDVNNNTTVSIGGLVFAKQMLGQTGYLLVPDKSYTAEYIYSGNATRLEYIDNYLLSVGKEYIGSLYYSGDSTTGYVYNATDNSQICYFDGVDCK